MSTTAVILPFVWATDSLQVIPPQLVEAYEEPDPPQMFFYRRYTEGMLQRYVRLSMETGRVSSLLGQEMFRGRVTTCRVESFEDVVIFVHDVEKCLEKLDEGQRLLISRLALQQYNVTETAELMRVRRETVLHRYGKALDTLTEIFLSVGLMELQKSCQGGKTFYFGINN
jgi:DNA-directed RNA polymerase specialized sigma24 family protein